MREKLAKALTEAQKSQDKTRLSTLRLICAAVKDRDISCRGAGKDPVSDKEIMEILSRMVKQREESAATYEEAGRIDLAEQERRESQVITEFMPEQLCEDSMKLAVAEVVKTTGATGLRDMGKCMNALKEQFAGQMDFTKASGIVKDMLR